MPEREKVIIVELIEVMFPQGGDKGNQYKKEDNYSERLEQLSSLSPMTISVSGFSVSLAPCFESFPYLTSAS